MKSENFPLRQVEDASWSAYVANCAAGPSPPSATSEYKGKTKTRTHSADNAGNRRYDGWRAEAGVRRFWQSRLICANPNSA